MFVNPIYSYIRAPLWTLNAFSASSPPRSNVINYIRLGLIQVEARCVAEIRIDTQTRCCKRDLDWADPQR